MKIDKIKQLHLTCRLQRKQNEVNYLSTIISEFDRRTKGNKDGRTLEEIEKGIFKEYYSNLIKTGNADARKELKFLRDEGIIDNMMSIQEIDLNLLDIYSEMAKKDDAFAKDPSRHKKVLTEFVKQFVPTVAEFQSVKERHNKVFNL